MNGALAVRAAGMVTGVGLDAPSSCAAMRCGLTAFAETRFRDGAATWIRGAGVPLVEGWRGRDRIVRLAAGSIGECLRAAAWPAGQNVPLLLLVAEASRPGRLGGLDRTMLPDVAALLPWPLARDSEVLPAGRAGIGPVLKAASERLASGDARGVVIAGADSLLRAPTLAAYERRFRLLTSEQSDGFLPGEGGAAVLVTRARDAGPGDLVCAAPGFGREKATIESGEPLRGDGMTQAFREALAAAGVGMEAVDYRIADLSGGTYGFKEASLALSRVLRERKEFMDLWHPGDCVGEMGAAIGPCVLGVALTAARKGYAPGPVALCHFAGEDGERVAVVVGAGAAGGR